MTQPLQIISSAMRSIGALASGDPIDPTTANDMFYLLNEMIDQWSTERIAVPAQHEVVHELTGGKYIYQIGTGGDVGCIFTGYIVPNPVGPGGVLTVTAISSGALSVGQVIQTSTGTGTLIVGTAITSYGAGTGGNTTSALGTYYVQQSQTIGSGTMSSYTPRPLRINSAFVRVINALTGTLDFPVAVISLDEYERLGIKSLPGPWPRAVYYQPSMPMGILNYWPNPSQGEMHLMCEAVLNQFLTLNDTVIFPQGVQGALHWNLAEKAMPEFGLMDPSQVEMIRDQAAQGRALLKRLAMNPQVPASFDDVLSVKTRKDASFFLHGGFA